MAYPWSQMPPVHAILARRLCAASVAAVTVIAARPAGPVVGAHPALRRAESHFALRSDPWVNLHLFLYHLARQDVLGQERLSGRVQIRDEDRRAVLSPGDSARWRQALEVYARYGGLDLLRSKVMPRIHLQLTKGPGAFPKGPDEPIYAALESVMPIYRAHWWPEHRAINEARIAELSAGLDRYEATFAPRLARDIGGTWPEQPIGVDVSVYASRAGAYTMNRPDRIVFASVPSEHPGLLGLEILFHESSHAESMAEPLTQASLDAAKAVGIDEDRLWHAALFYVAAGIARDLFPEGYQPYPWRYGLFVNGSMSVHLPVLEESYEASAPLGPMMMRIHRARLARIGAP